MWPSYKDIEFFYRINCYTNEDIGTYVEYGVLTPEEYKRMTGEDYKEPQAD